MYIYLRASAVHLILAETNSVGWLTRDVHPLCVRGCHDCFFSTNGKSSISLPIG